MSAAVTTVQPSGANPAQPIGAGGIAALEVGCGGEMLLVFDPVGLTELAAHHVNGVSRECTISNLSIGGALCAITINDHVGAVCEIAWQPTQVVPPAAGITLEAEVASSATANDCA